MTETSVPQPLTEATFFILLSLAPGSKHGYAIMKEARILSDNRVVLSTGTLYGALKRLLEHEWIMRVEDRENGTERERKAYTLTNQGQHALKLEIERLRRLVSTARVRTIQGRA